MRSIKQLLPGWLRRDRITAVTTKPAVRTWMFLKDQVFPQICAMSIRKKLRQREAAFGAEPLRLDGQELDEEALRATIQFIEIEYKNEEDRRKGLTEKARAALLVIGVVVALATSSPAFVSASGITLCEVFILVVTVAMFVLSAVTLTLAVDVRSWHGRYLDDRITNNQGVLTVTSLPPRDEVIELYRGCKRNQSVVTDIANLVSASYLGIRNGILCLAVLFLIVVTRLTLASFANHAAVNVPAISEVDSMPDALAAIRQHHAEIARVTIPACRTLVLREPDGRTVRQANAGMILELKNGNWFVLSGPIAESLLNDPTRPLQGITLHIEP